MQDLQTHQGGSNSLLANLPELQRVLPWVPLGAYPTPLERCAALCANGQDTYFKREDLSAPLYGGNKVRTLEFLFADALQRGARRIWSTGAFGSNHALATAVHAPRVGLQPGALLFPQPATRTAGLNLAALISVGAHLWPLRSIVQFPFAFAWQAVRGTFAGARDAVMVPGGAIPTGAFGHASGGLELAMQVKEGIAPAPHHIVLPIGSTCTTAGLMVGVSLAARLGVSFANKRPHIYAVRVTPYPVTAPFRVRSLAKRTAAALDALLPRPLGLVEAVTQQPLTVVGEHFGWGYGRPTKDGVAALRYFEYSGLVPLDTTYSAKAAAGLLALRHKLDGPIAFWSTKSSVPLPADDTERLAAALRWVRRWLAKAQAHTI